MVRANKGACGISISSTAMGLSQLEKEQSKKIVPELKIDDFIVNDITKEDERWDIFEDWVVNLYHPKNYPDHWVRLWKDMDDEEELLKMGLIQSYKNQREARTNVSRQDTGSDFVALDRKTGEYFVGQCKCYTSCNLGQNMKLSGFFLHSGKMNISGGFIYSYSELTQQLKENLNGQKNPIQYHVVGKEFEEYYQLHYPRKSIERDVDDNASNEVSLPLLPHQERAVKAICEPNDNDNQYLHMACGTGKTKTCGQVLQNKRPKVIICTAPLLLAVDQLKRRLPSFLGDDYKTLLVDSDTSIGGTTDPEEVRKFLLENDRVILFTTFESFHITASMFMNDSPIRPLSDTYLVVDELHNVLRKDRLCDHIKIFPHSLYMSATITDELVDKLGGRMSFNYSVASAINDSIICDYELILPRLDTNLTTTKNELMAEINGDVDDDNVDDDSISDVMDGDGEEIDVVETSTYLSSAAELKAKAEFLVTGMLKTGSKRCIVYLSSLSEFGLFEQYYREQCELQGIEPWVGTIDCKVGAEDRNRRLKEFESNEDFNKYVMLSVRVLNEAIDIPRCDSVFITNVGEQTSDIGVMQRVCRGTRLDKTNERKICHAFLWTTDKSEAIAALHFMRQADADFHKKIRYMSPHYDEQGVEQEAKDKKAADEMIEFVLRIRSWMDVWDMKCSALENFCREHKRLPTKKDGYLGGWRYYQKRLYVRGILKEEQISRLMAIEEFRRWVDDWVDDPLTDMSYGERWEANYQALVEYCQLHNALPPQSYEVIFNGTTLKVGQWLANQQTRFNGIGKRTAISDIEREKLMAIEQFRAWAEDPLRDDDVRWEANYQALVEYCQLHNALPPRRYEMIFNGTTLKLGVWLKTQQTRFKGIGKGAALSDIEREKLMAIEQFREWSEKRVNSDKKKETKTSTSDKPNKKKTSKKAREQVCDIPSNLTD